MAWRGARTLIVGGGIAGMSAAISLRRLGLHVDLVEIDPQWKVYGAGITITGPTLRAFKALGVLDDLLAGAYAGNGIRVCGVDGRFIRDIPTPMPPEAGVPGSGGVMRPVLHAILSSAVRASGARVSLGMTIDALQERDGREEVTFSDGSSARYDLVIGADGLFSKVRTLLFPELPQPAYTGQCIWRLVVPRPSAIDRRHFFLGGPVKVGLSPVSADEMYMFLLETRAEKRRLNDAVLPGALAHLLEGYGGVLRGIREGLGESSRIVYRPLEAFPTPPRWHADRVLLIGDAVHPTTPQLASGAGMAVEDALVLADELGREDTLLAALQRFSARRYERCRLVVENSLEIGRLEQRGAAIEEQTALVEHSLELLAQPI